MADLKISWKNTDGEERKKTLQYESDGQSGLSKEDADKVLGSLANAHVIGADKKSVNSDYVSLQIKVASTDTDTGKSTFTFEEIQTKASGTPPPSGDSSGARLQGDVKALLKGTFKGSAEIVGKYPTKTSGKIDEADKAAAKKIIVEEIKKRKKGDPGLKIDGVEINLEEGTDKNSIRLTPREIQQILNPPSKKAGEEKKPTEKNEIEKKAEEDLKPRSFDVAKYVQEALEKAKTAGEAVERIIELLLGMGISEDTLAQIVSMFSQKFGVTKSKASAILIGKLDAKNEKNVALVEQLKKIADDPKMGARALAIKEEMEGNRQDIEGMVALQRTLDEGQKMLNNLTDSLLSENAQRSQRTRWS